MTMSSSMESLSDVELALRVQQGSRACFAELANRFGPRLYNYFRQKVGCREDCEDLVQDTLLKAYRNIHLYRERWAFTTWIFTIGTRKVVDHFRANGNLERELIPGDLFSSSQPEEKVELRDETDNLWRLALKLPRKQYDALWLRYVEELPIKEIARILTVPRVQVKVLLFRARTRLASLDKRRQAVKMHGACRMKHPLSYCRGTEP
jgi:RNA polymerase sigma-70 factor (ECF subfamily)